MRRRLFALLAFALLLAPLAVPGPALAAPTLTVTPTVGPSYPFEYVFRATGLTPGAQYVLALVPSDVKSVCGCAQYQRVAGADGTIQMTYDGSLGDGSFVLYLLYLDPSLGVQELAVTGFQVGGVPAPSPPPPPAPAPGGVPVALQGPPLTFPPGTTPFSVAGAFRAQWETRGGLPINGYPLSEVFLQRLEDGTSYWVQYFERVRMEYHPEVADPLYQVQLGQFGRRLHPLDPPAAMQPGAAYFPETKHNVGGGFLAYWQANGGLAQFGFPLSEVVTETLEDGNAYPVQYFERARFEYHGAEVLLGQFGRRVLAETGR